MGFKVLNHVYPETLNLSYSESLHTLGRMIITESIRINMMHNNHYDTMILPLNLLETLECSPMFSPAVSGLSFKNLHYCGAIGYIKVYATLEISNIVTLTSNSKRDSRLEYLLNNVREIEDFVIEVNSTLIGSE